MLRDTQVSPRPAAVFVPDVAFADIAGQHQYFLGGMERSSLAKPHASLVAASPQAVLVAGQGVADIISADCWSTGVRGIGRKAVYRARAGHAASSAHRRFHNPSARRGARATGQSRDPAGTAGDERERHPRNRGRSSRARSSQLAALSAGRSPRRTTCQCLRRHRTCVPSTCLASGLVESFASALSPVRPGTAKTARAPGYKANDCAACGEVLAGRNRNCTISSVA